MGMNSKISIQHYLLDIYLYFSGNFFHRKQNLFINKLCKRFFLKNKLILDIGSSTGYYSFYFLCHSNKVIGIEPSDAYLYASKRFKKYNIKFINENISYIYNNLNKNSFNFIFCSNLPLHYDTGEIRTSINFKTFINNIMDYITVGGVLYYCFYSSKHEKVTHHVTTEDMKIVLEENGIINYKLNSITPIDYPMVELVICKD